MGVYKLQWVLFIGLVLGLGLDLGLGLEMGRIRIKEDSD